MSLQTGYFVFECCLHWQSVLLGKVSTIPQGYMQLENTSSSAHISSSNRKGENTTSTLLSKYLSLLVHFPSAN